MTAIRVLAFLSLIAGFSRSQTSDCSYYGLLNHLNLTSTNTVLNIMRPVKNWTDSTLVRLDMLLLGILEVEEKSQTVTNHIWIFMTWTNEFLTWNSSDFCGIKDITLPRSMIWVPDVGITEDVSDTGSIQDGPLVVVDSGGLVFASTRQRLTYTCSLNLLMFPFDTQYCNITFSSMSFNEEAMHLETFSSDKVLSKISEEAMVTMGEWDLKNLRVSQDPRNKSILLYTVVMQRKPMLYIVNFIVPLFFFLSLDLASYFISEARGEKLSFKVTILLSISVLLLILQDMLPSTENNMPMIANYCAGVFTLVGISVLEAMMVTFLIDLDCYCGKKARGSVNASEEIQLEVDKLKEPGEVEGNSGVKPELLKLILDEVKAAREDVRRKDKDNQKRGRYRRLAEITDHVFFVLYFTVSVLFLVFLYLAWVPKLI